ncbi:10511_t:CDS:1, partial [Funneliformis caledonium]
NLVQEEIYGEVEYFVSHEHNELTRIFAYVHKIDDLQYDNYG